MLEMANEVVVALVRSVLPASVVDESVALVPNTADPLPVSSLIAAASAAEVKVPNEVVLPTEVTTPVKLALVVTVAALPLIEPLMV